MILKFSHTLLFLLISINLWSQTPSKFEHIELNANSKKVSFNDVIDEVEIILEDFLKNLDSTKISIKGGKSESDLLSSENPVLLKIKFK